MTFSYYVGISGMDNQLRDAAEKGDAVKLSSLIQEIPKDHLAVVVNKGDNQDRTPLNRAAENGHAECVKLLLEAKADPNKGDNENRTPLYWVAQYGHAECVKLLL